METAEITENSLRANLDSRNLTFLKVLFLFMLRFVGKSVHIKIALCVQKETVQMT